MRNLGNCQAQFQAAGHVDLDGDGVGEFGTFGELTAADGLRAGPSGETRGAPLSPPILSPALANVPGPASACTPATPSPPSPRGRGGPRGGRGGGHGWDWKGAGAG